MNATMTRNQTDGATARPWHIETKNGNPQIYSPPDCFLGHKLICKVDYGFECEANAALIVRAVNEWEALKAIEGLAEEIESYSQGGNTEAMRDIIKNELPQALSTLQQLRGKECNEIH